MNKQPLLILLLLTITFVSSCRHNNDKLWNEIASHFTDSSRTKEEIINKLSPTTVHAILQHPVTDTIPPIVNFFESLKDEHNYEVHKDGDTVYFSFHLSEIAGGPFIDVIKNGITGKYMTFGLENNPAN